MLFVSTVSSFLHIMTRHNVHFCTEKQTPLYDSNYFSFELYSITDDENEQETIFISFKKGQIPVNTFIYMFFPSDRNGIEIMDACHY